MKLSLRPAAEGDADVYFALQRDDEAVRMAAFVPDVAPERSASDTRWSRTLADPGVVVKMIEVDGLVVGLVLKYVADGWPEVSYWVVRQHWGLGYATEALRLLLREVTERPIRARTSADNVGSLRVLARNGFTVVAEGTGFAVGRGEVVPELVLTLTG